MVLFKEHLAELAALNDTPHLKRSGYSVGRSCDLSITLAATWFLICGVSIRKRSSFAEVSAAK